MNIGDFFDLVEWDSFFQIFAVVLGLSIILFRRCSYSFYDPGWMAIGALSIAVALILYLKIEEGVGNWNNVLYMCGAFLSFLLGARGAYKILHAQQYRTLKIDYNSIKSRVEFQKLLHILYFLQIVIVLLVLIRAATQGLPILSEDPELAKVEVNAGGFGLISRLLGPSLMMAVSITVILMTKHFLSPLRGALMMLPPIVALISSGSKSALAIFLISFVAVHIYLESTDVRYRPPRAGWFVLMAVVAIVTYAFTVLLLRGAGEEDPIAFASKTFSLRFFAAGDAVFYFFIFDLYKLISFQPIDYIWDYFLSPVLSMLRITDYHKSLGLQISGEMFGADKMGPNPTVFVEGYVYFGAMAGLVYSFCIGIVFQLLRNNVFLLLNQFSAWHYLRYILFFSMSQIVAVDMIMFVGEIMNAIIMLSIIWFLYQLLILARFASKARAI